MPETDDIIKLFDPELIRSTDLSYLVKIHFKNKITWRKLMNTTQINLKVAVEQCNDVTNLLIEDQLDNSLDFDKRWLEHAQMHLKEANMCVTRAGFEKVPSGKK